MALHQISILGAGTVPDNNGDVFFQKYSSIDSPNNADMDPLVLIFNDANTIARLRGSFVVPQNFVDGAKIIIPWTANATTGTTVWLFGSLARTAGEDMGGSTLGATDGGPETKSAVPFALEIASITIASAAFAPGDIVLFSLGRDSIADTMAAPAAVFEIIFEYSDVVII